MESELETNILQDKRVNSILNKISKFAFVVKARKGNLRNLDTHPMLFAFIIFWIHVFGIIGIIQICEGGVLTSTIVFALILAEIAMFSITIGSHRLFAHRTFKATPPLKNFLAVCNFFAGQNSLWLWCAWHRVHHKCVDTYEDPHNSMRGFFYSHIGWLVLYDRQQFRESLKKVDMSDLKQEPIVMFHRRHILLIQLMCMHVIPTVIPWYFFGESFYTAFCVASCLRYVWIFHRTFLVNSAAHMWGDRPYDTSIRPVENRLVSILTNGEGWHNYHHVFPWDYKTSELGFYRWNLSTALIDVFAWAGLAYDLKSVSEETVMKRVARTGDLRHFEGGPWGWGDKSIPEENIQQTVTFHPKRNS